MGFLQGGRRVMRLGVVAATLALSGPTAYAQKPSAAAMLTANEIVAVTNATALFSPVIAGVVEQAKILFLQQNPALSKDVNEVAEKLRNELTPRMSEVRGEVARLYAASFTEQELKDMLAFYKSPVGKKILSEQPKIVDASLKFAQDWANKLSDEVVAKMRAELKKKGHAL